MPRIPRQAVTCTTSSISVGHIGKSKYHHLIHFLFVQFVNLGESINLFSSKVFQVHKIQHTFAGDFLLKVQGTELFNDQGRKMLNLIHS